MHPKLTLTTLTRLASCNPEQAKRLDQFFHGRLAETASDVAVETGDPMGSILARQIEAASSPETAERLVWR